MTKQMFLTILMLLFIPAAAQSQSLHPSFGFSRESNSKGSTDYVLKPVVDEIHKKVGGADKPYQVLGALARPKTQGAVLLFANAQTESQLYSQTDKSVVVKADSLELRNLQYELAGQSEDDSGPKLEIANVLINFNDFRKIAAANSVTVKFGGVTYSLDKDNLDALRYMAAEIEKDLSKAF